METPLNKRIKAYRAIITVLENLRITSKATEKDTIGLVLDSIQKSYNVLIHQKSDANETADVVIQPFANLLDKGGEIKANKASQQENQQPAVVKKPIQCNEPSKTINKQEEPKPVLNVANAGSQSKNDGILEKKPGPSHETLTTFSATPLRAYDVSKAEKDKNEGDSFLSKKLYGDAIVKYSRAIEFNPGDATLFFKRGVAHSFLELHKHSISDFERAIELDPTFKEAYIHLAMEYIVQEQFCIAKQVLFKVINYEPENKKLRIMLDVVEKELLADRKNRSSSSESPHFNFNTEHSTPSKYSKDISRAATALLREPGSANIVNVLLKRSTAKQNPVLGVLIHMRDKLNLNQTPVEYKLPLKYQLETYAENKE